jgi:hypothetical protein
LRQTSVPLIPEALAQQGEILPSPSGIRLGMADGPIEIVFELQAFDWRRACPDNSEDAALGAASAGGEVEPAVFANVEVSDIEWLAFEQDFGFG